MKSLKVFLAGLLIFIGMSCGFIIIISIVRGLRQNYTFSPLIPLIGFLIILMLPVFFFNIAFKILNTKDSSKNDRENVDQREPADDEDKDKH